MTRGKITVSAVGAVAAAVALVLEGPTADRTVSFSLNDTVNAASQFSNFTAATVRYHCGFPLVGSQPVVAAIAWNTPPAIEAGRLVPSSALSVQATFSSRAMWGLTLLGVAGFDGSAAMNSDIHAPQGDLPEKITLNVPRVGVPSSGSMTVSAAGSTPSLTFGQAGPAELDAGAVTMHLQGYASNGSRTLPFDLGCTLDAGQSGAVATFDIAVAGSPTSAPSSSAAPTPSAPSGAASQPATSGNGSTSGTKAPGAAVPTSGTTPSSTSSNAAIAPVSTSDTGATGSPAPADSAPALAAAAHASTLGPSGSAAASTAVDKGAAVTDWLLVACALLLVGAAGIFAAARLKRRT